MWSADALISGGGQDFHERQQIELAERTAGKAAFMKEFASGASTPGFT
jgi:hypothetical protein